MDPMDKTTTTNKQYPTMPAKTTDEKIRQTIRHILKQEHGLADKEFTVAVKPTRGGKLEFMVKIRHEKKYADCYKALKAKQSELGVEIDIAA